MAPNTINSEFRQSLVARIFNQILLLFVTAFYLIAFPTTVLAFTPIYLFRFLAFQCKKHLRPDLAELVHTRSIVLAVDGGFPQKPTWNLVVWLTQDGILSLEKFSKDFTKEYVQKKDPNGDLSYPEYQQHLERWWGFYFWRWDTEFDIRNHIRRYDGKYKDAPVVDDKTLLQIIKELTWKGWHPRRSPWEFLQIPNYKGDGDEIGKSILIFRIHHVLGDGYYILKLLMEDICGISLQKAAQPKYVRREKLISRLIYGFLFWIRAPYQFVSMLCEAKDTNPWHIPESKLTRPMNAALTPKIQLSYIKGIKNAHNVSFTAVINAAVTGGIRNMMIEQGITELWDIHQAVAVPLPGHPPKLRNHFIFSFVTLPVGTSDPIQRLHKIEDYLLAKKNSTVSLLSFWKVPLVGALFPEMMSPLIVNTLSTCLMSNFPGTPEIPHFKEVNVVDMMFAVGLGPGNTGVGFTLISYVDTIRLLSTADPSILSSDEMVEKLNEKILQEFEILKELGERKLKEE